MTDIPGRNQYRMRMRVDDVSSPLPSGPTRAGQSALKAELLYELELELRRTAKALARRQTPLAPLVLRTAGTGKRPVDSWEDTGKRGWMIGPNVGLLEDGKWVAYVSGRSHKLDKPRHQIFGDAVNKGYAMEWQALTDAGVVPGARYIRVEAEHRALVEQSLRERRADLLEVRRVGDADVLALSYDWGRGGPRTDVLRDDLHKWTADYFR